MNAAQKEAADKRLKRIAGQLAGIQRMVDDDRYCIDVMMQIAAVRAALSRVAQHVLSAHIDTCVASAFASGSTAVRQEKLNELFDVFSRFGKL